MRWLVPFCWQIRNSHGGYLGKRVQNLERKGQGWGCRGSSKWGNVSEFVSGRHSQCGCISIPGEMHHTMRVEFLHVSIILEVGFFLMRYILRHRIERNGVFRAEDFLCPLVMSIPCSGETSEERHLQGASSAGWSSRNESHDTYPSYTRWNQRF